MIVTIIADVRVVVDENATQDEMIAQVRNKIGISDFITEIIDEDGDDPYDPERDGV